MPVRPKSMSDCRFWMAPSGHYVRRLDAQTRTPRHQIGRQFGEGRPIRQPWLQATQRLRLKSISYSFRRRQTCFKLKYLSIYMLQTQIYLRNRGNTMSWSMRYIIPSSIWTSTCRLLVSFAVSGANIVTCATIVRSTSSPLLYLAPYKLISVCSYILLKQPQFTSIFHLYFTTLVLSILCHYFAQDEVNYLGTL